MEKYTVKFSPDKKSIAIDKGEDLLSAASLAGLRLNSSCGGEGVCGRCKVIIKHGSYNKDKFDSISESERKKGYVLACQTIVEDNIEVFVPSESRIEFEPKRAESIYTKTEEVSEGEDLLKKKFPHNPLSKKIYLELEKPNLSDKVTDLDRIYRKIDSKLKVKNISTSLSNLKRLGNLLRDSGWLVTTSLVHKDEGYELILIEPQDTSDKNFGLCFDIGTTTVTGQLVNLNTKKVLGTKATYNKQISFGDDVITRIVYASEKKGLEKLHIAIIENINEIIKELVEEHGISFGDILVINLSGNTTMIHLLLGIDPTFIRREPYTATSNFFTPLHAAEINISINPRGYLYTIPGISSYVGGDAVSGVLATGLYDSEELSLLIDIGTNGEIVLGNREWMISCAASAGPAFEGSGMSCGIRAMKGAIERVNLSDKGRDVQFKTIGDAKPIGICGSGYIDIIAKFLKEGIISKSGRIIQEPASNKRIRETEGGREFIIASKKEFHLEKDIVISDTDIENIKRSKGAIYSAVATLIKKLELNFDEIKKVFIGGGFGTYLDVENAIYIGLLPDLSRDRFVFVGNSSLIGCREILLSDEARKKSYEIAKEISYLELSNEPLYMDEYVKSLFFPHTEMERFKSFEGAYGKA